MLEAFFAQPEITAMKRTKKGEREISLKEHLHGLSLQADGDMVLLADILQYDYLEYMEELVGNME